MITICSLCMNIILIKHIPPCTSIAFILLYNVMGDSIDVLKPNASRPLLRCRSRAQYEVHELPLFVEKSRSCRVVQERALVQHEQVASKKNSLHEHTRALYVIDTRRLFYDELNAMSLGWRCDENQFNIFFNWPIFFGGILHRSAL